ncbi:hypothetical protein [Sinomonas sp. ASV322]|uniref:hypothetical protein n=1 Tax=Sinomonas sp. ASV322 TaxID=3041920 RepID=UPI0027DB7968|nr:hypothetical protein [Sinomonas sp. ASV322]MDQ4504417.1 hypothetical protein [Sinomonas sp. ASV322]
MRLLADVIAAAADARHSTPAQIDYALASGASDAEVRAMLVSGATHLAMQEMPGNHPEGLTLALVGRREEILAAAMGGLELRRLEASVLGYRVLDEGDDETPAAVVYADSGSTGADWADTLL